MIAIDKIYIVHYTPLTSRKEHLLQQFAQNGIINYKFWEKYDRNTTPKEVMDTYFKLDNLTHAQICITISHIDIYRDILSNGYSSCLILEDDAILCDDFITKFNSYMKTIPSDYDLAFLNNGCDLHASDINPDKIWYHASSSRTCCAYLITKSACALMLQTIVPFEKAIDHELNRQIKLHDFHVYWCEPTIVSDGSMTYGSSYVYYEQGKN